MIEAKTVKTKIMTESGRLDSRKLDSGKLESGKLESGKLESMTLKVDSIYIGCILSLVKGLCFPTFYFPAFHFQGLAVRLLECQI